MQGKGQDGQLHRQDGKQTGGAAAASMWFELKLEWQRWFVE